MQLLDVLNCKEAYITEPIKNLSLQKTIVKKSV